MKKYLSWTSRSSHPLSRCFGLLLGQSQCDRTRSQVSLASPGALKFTLEEKPAGAWSSAGALYVDHEPREPQEVAWTKSEALLFFLFLRSALSAMAVALCQCACQHPRPEPVATTDPVKMTCLQVSRLQRSTSPFSSRVKQGYPFLLQEPEVSVAGGRLQFKLRSSAA